MIDVRIDTAELDRLLETLADRCTGGLVAPLKMGLEAVAREASAAWYTQVDWETGTTGQIDTTVTLGADWVAVSVGSKRLDRTVGKQSYKSSDGGATFDRTKATTGAYVAQYVHRPGPTSTIREVQPRTAALPPGGRVVRHMGANVLVSRPNPKASDGKAVLPILVTNPARAVLDRLLDDGTIDRAIQRRIDGGG